VQALPAYDAGIMKPDKIQYTIRGIPPELDTLVREKASEYGTSINETLIKVIEAGLGQIRHHDLDKFAGTWPPDEAFDQAIETQRTIDPDLILSSRDQHFDHLPQLPRIG
jgi:hypothetical protein